MSEAYILSACRTPIGKFGGALSGVPAPELGAQSIRHAVQRAGAAPGDVDEVIMGNVLAAGLGQAPARQAALGAGLPATVAALTINKVCGSGLKAAMLAAQGVRCGDAELIVAGGMESMSRAGWVLPREGPVVGERTLVDSLLHDGLRCAFSGRSMGEIAERLAERAGISRNDQDQYALGSHRRAVEAMESGAFAEELVPVPVSRKGRVEEVTADEGPRRETSLEALARLRPAFGPEGTVTAGNSSMLSDGAAAVVVASERGRARIGAQPLARILGSVTVGGEPEEVFTAPVAAIQEVVLRAGLTLEKVGLFELNEAFAAQMLACLRPLKIPLERVNVHGGAVALGHPIGASGARVLVSLLHALRRRDETYGVAALCLGGGNAVAMLVERILPPRV